MTNPVSMDTPVTVRQAFLIMYAYLEMHWESVNKPDEIGALLSDLSLWETESSGKEPMDATVFPTWLECAQSVLAAESTPEGYRNANILIDGRPPVFKVHR